MARKKRTIEELQNASEHVTYEYRMLIDTAKILSNIAADKSPLANAVLESFLIHLRAILDFLSYANPQTDDISAQDFFPCPDQWRSYDIKMSEFLQFSRNRANKEVAHLTYARLAVTEERKKWEFLKISEEITELMMIFFREVAAEVLGSDSRVLKRYFSNI